MDIRFNPDNMLLHIDYPEVSVLMEQDIKASSAAKLAYEGREPASKVLWDVNQHCLWGTRIPTSTTYPKVSKEVFNILVSLPTVEERLVYLNAVLS